jgi:ParB family chromosome partitioning protein
MRTIAVAEIDANPYQTRHTYTEKSMNELKQSIEQLGIITPLVLRAVKGRFQLVSGSRRFKAAQELGLKEVPAIILELSDKEVMEITITENLQREDLNAIEEAQGLKRLLEEFGYTHEKLAERLGKSRSYITNSLRLLNLTPFVQTYVLCKTLTNVTAWHARCLLPLKDCQQVRFADLIWDWNLSVQETREIVNRYMNGEKFLYWQRNIPLDGITVPDDKFRKIPSAASYEVRAIKESIKRLGLLQPIKVLVTGRLLDGGIRLAACRELGWKQIPAFIVFFSEWIIIQGETSNKILSEVKGRPRNLLLEKMDEMKVAKP